MKTIFRVFGIVAMVLVIGLSIVACSRHCGCHWDNCRRTEECTRNGCGHWGQCDIRRTMEGSCRGFR